MTNLKATKKALVSSVLALVMCFTMLLGTTFAWFTDSVTSANNVIQTGTLDVGFQWAEGNEDPSTATWNDVEGALFNYANWEPGYAVAKHLKISNNGSLGLNYKVRIFANGVVSDLAEVIDVYVVAGAVDAMDRNTLAGLEPVGTLTQVLLASGADDAENEADMGYDVSELIKGSLDVDADDHVYTLVLKMNENAGNEYQDMDLGCTFSVQLLATQMAAEEDSFDNQYDAVVPNEEIPAALVRPLDNLSVVVGEHVDYGDMSGNLTLDTGYKFQPTASLEDNEKSLYRHWIADYVVYADADVPANSMALAGYYKLFCEGFNDGNWIALRAEEDIAAGTEIRLVEAMGGGDIFVSYKDICQWGADGYGFQCGAVDLTGENMGTTITVELRIYETTADWTDSRASSEETGNYITIGKFEYTFGVNTAEKLEYALTNSGEYKLTSDIELDADDTITVPADVTTVIDLNGYTITAVSDDADENDDGKLTSADNEVAIDVRGNLTVKNGTITMEHKSDNFGWNACTEVFYVAFNGTLNVDNAVIANLGGSDMAYAIDIVNATNATVNVTNSTLKSTYIPVRVFNNGTGMNHVTIKNTKLDGVSRAFWVHIYSNADNSGKGIKDATLDLDIYGNGNTFIAKDPARIIEFGFTDEINFDANGNQI